MIPQRALLTALVLFGGLLSAPLPLLAIQPSSPAIPAPSMATLVQSSQVPYLGEMIVNHRTRLRVWHGAGDRRRQEVLSPAAMMGELIVDNGRTRWHYSPRTQDVDVSPSSLSLRRPDTSERLLSSNFRLIAIGQETVAGRPTRIVELRSIYPARGSQRLWLDTATGLPLRIERRDPEGHLVESSEFTSIQVPAKLKSETFEFVVPSRAKVTTNVQVIASGRSLPELKTRLPFPVKMPTYLPPGFEVLDVHVIETKGVRSLHWRLSDGLDMLSLFQTNREHFAPRPALAEAFSSGLTQGYLVTHGDHRMLCWKTRAGAFTLIGDLGKAELDQIAASTAP